MANIAKPDQIVALTGQANELCRNGSRYRINYQVYAVSDACHFCKRYTKPSL